MSLTPGLLYKASSKFWFAKTLAYRAVFFFVALFASFHFEDNKVGISIVLGFCLLVFMTVGDEEVMVYPDRIIVFNNSLFLFLIGKRSRTYQIADLTDIWIVESATAIKRVLSRWSSDIFVSRDRNDLRFQLRSDKIISVGWGWDDYVKEKVMEIVKKLLKSNES